MRILVISDLHLKKEFNLLKYKLLKDLIQSSDKVIINGDFYDGILISFKQFIDSPWKKLFPLLRQKRTVYVLGNHDFDALNEEQTKLFCKKKCIDYRLKLEESRYFITHGHREGYSKYDEINAVRIIKRYSWEPIYDFISGHLISRFGINILSSKLAQLENQNILRKIRSKIPSSTSVLYGHTHYMELDEKNKAYNTGIFNYGIAQYAIIDNEGIKLINDKY